MQWGSKGTGPGQFDSPKGVALDGSGSSGKLKITASECNYPSKIGVIIAPVVQLRTS